MNWTSSHLYHFCFGVFGDAVFSYFEVAFDEHCVTEDGHTVAQIKSRPRPVL